MKKLFLTALIAVSGFLCFAQANNSYNQRGIDYIASVNMIGSDIASGKVKDFTEQSIKDYSAKIPLKTESSMAMVAEIIKTIKASDFNFGTMLDKSSLSAAAIRDFKDIYYLPKGTTAENYKALLSAKTDWVNQEKISGAEKELLLSVIAIAYNMQSSSQNKQGAPAQSNCEVFGPDGSGPVNCIVAGAVVGAYIGFRICGIWCALGGAVVGGVLGSFT